MLNLTQNRDIHCIYLFKNLWKSLTVWYYFIILFKISVHWSSWFEYLIECVLVPCHPCLMNIWKAEQLYKQIIPQKCHFNGTLRRFTAILWYEFTISCLQTWIYVCPRLSYPFSSSFQATVMLWERVTSKKRLKTSFWRHFTA